MGHAVGWRGLPLGIPFLWSRTELGFLICDVRVNSIHVAERNDGDERSPAPPQASFQSRRLTAVSTPSLLSA